MIAFLITIHVIVSIALIIVVLLQAGKGAEMGATFGTGGSQSLFGVGGGATFLSKLTTSAAIIFMLTSLTLAYLSSKPLSTSIMPSTVKPTSVMPRQAVPQQNKPAGALPAQSQQPAKK
ncbi:MAG TPA: preprotein translocase subunit SecG [Geobacteraceae bacterium]|nr:preprotein translocase subunit SecG [Geobacteraceae bacterium]